MSARNLICANKVLIILYRPTHLGEGGIYYLRAHVGELIGGDGAGANGGEINAGIDCRFHIGHAVADIKDIIERDARLFGEVKDSVGLGLVRRHLVGADDGIDVLVHSRALKRTPYLIGRFKREHGEGDALCVKRTKPLGNSGIKLCPLAHSFGRIGNVFIVKIFCIGGAAARVEIDRLGGQADAVAQDLSVKIVAETRGVGVKAILDEECGVGESQVEICDYCFIFIFLHIKTPYVF